MPIGIGCFLSKKIILFLDWRSRRGEATCTNPTVSQQLSGISKISVLEDPLGLTNTGKFLTLYGLSSWGEVGGSFPSGTVALLADAFIQKNFHQLM